MAISTWRISGAAACIVMLVELVGPASMVRSVHEHPDMMIDGPRPPSTVVRPAVLRTVAPDHTLVLALTCQNTRRLA